MAIYFDDVQGDVASVFLSYFQRAPEFEAMQWYAGVLEGLQNDPATADNAFNLLAAHIYADGVAAGEVPAGPTVTDAWYVTYLYGNILGRAPDAEGQAYWTAQLQNGAIARAELVGTFIAAALAAGGRDTAYVENRTFVAVEFAQWENSNPQVLPTLKYNAAEVMYGVNEDPATVAAAQERLESHTGPIGDTWNLTTGIDTIEGTTGNDTINAVFDSSPSNPGSTLTAFDHIDGGLGMDTLNIYVKDAGVNGAFPNTARVENVEVVKVFNGGAINPAPGSGFSYLNNLSHYGGLEQFWQIGTAQSVMAVGEGVLVGFSGVQELAVEVALANGVTSAGIMVSGVGTADTDPALLVRGEHLAAVDIDGGLATAGNELQLEIVAGRNVRSVSLSTDVDTRVEVARHAGSNAASLIHTLDFSGSTGDLVFYIGEDQAASLVGIDAALTVTFGSGDDIIIFDDRALSLRDNIDGGEGYDTVVLTMDGRLQTQNYDAIARLQNIDELVFGGNYVEVDAAEVADFDLSFTGDGDVILSNLASGRTITVGGWGGDEPDTVTLKAAGKDVSISLESGVSFALVIDPNAAGEKGGSLMLYGDGAVLYSNAATGKFAVIDGVDLEGVEAAYDEIAQFIAIDVEEGSVNVGLVLAALDDENETASSGMSGAVAETVRLSADTLDVVVVDINLNLVGAPPMPSPWVSQNSSTYGKMDVIEHFNSDAAAGPLDYLVGPGEITKFDLAPNDNTLQLAFQAAAEAFSSIVDDDPAVTAIYFHFGGDTYLFADTVGGESGQYDNADFALKLLGVHEGLEEQWVGFALV